MRRLSLDSRHFAYLQRFLARTWNEHARPARDLRWPGDPAVIMNRTGRPLLNLGPLVPVPNFFHSVEPSRAARGYKLGRTLNKVLNKRITLVRKSRGFKQTKYVVRPPHRGPQLGHFLPGEFPRFGKVVF